MGKTKLVAGVTDLGTLHPELAREADGWDPTKVASRSNKKLPWLCKEGHRWRTGVNARTGANKSGCPDCAEYGFKPGKPSWLYLLERPGEQQLGVTNEPGVRLKHHSSNGWTEVEVVGPFAGKLVLETEKTLKKWLKKEVGLVPGTHENWFTAKLEVRSLAELKAKSGVETELL